MQMCVRVCVRERERFLSICLSILQHPLVRIMCRVDCDLKSDARTEKEKVKGDSIKRTSAEFKKNRLKTALLLYYGRQWSRNRTACHTELVECRQHDNLSW